LKNRLRVRSTAHIQARYGVDLTFAIEQPRQSEFGELAVPAAFQLAKQLRQAPKKIAAELVEEIGEIDGIASMEVAGNGYINLRIDRGAYGAALLRGDSDEPEGSGEKIIVEHTNINPNKAAHIGHVRNSVLGDTFVRMLRAGGYQVEVQNYIDNTGVQVADVVVGFYHLENKTAAEVKALITDPAVRFDYYCWGPLRADLAILQRTIRVAGVAQRHAALDRIRRGRGSGVGACGGGCDRQRAPGRQCFGWVSSTMCCRARARSCT
jgi:arginyl-tRNA synthetase